MDGATLNTILVVVVPVCWVSGVTFLAGVVHKRRVRCAAEKERQEYQKMREALVRGEVYIPHPIP